jgi:hypothetical protein
VLLGMLFNHQKEGSGGMAECSLTPEDQPLLPLHLQLRHGDRNQRAASQPRFHGQAGHQSDPVA